MKSPSTPEQLADAIESLVASYMGEALLTVQRAVERSLTRGVAARRPSKGNDSRGGPTRPTRAAAKRRTQTELEGVREELYERVRARPGASMVALAEEMGVPPCALWRPMAKLRTDGRVRSVGKQHLMRYFPAVVRAAAGKE